MTGFGREYLNFRSLQLSIEIKALNSKYFDVNLKIPAFLKHKEFAIRNTLQENLLRGKIDCTILLEGQENFELVKINESIAKEYLEQLRNFCDKNELSAENLLSQILHMPNVLESDVTEMNESEWEGINKALVQAVDKLTKYRMKEGKVLKDDLLNSLFTIESCTKKIDEIAPQRKSTKREKIESLLTDFDTTQIDGNRLEQELLFYIEKLDINEELSRLKGHCEYFREILDSDNSTKGKKLGFLSQELGREINTIGSKANNSDIQRHVVLMKEELEKIKEQVNNAL